MFILPRKYEYVRITSCDTCLQAKANKAETGTLKTATKLKQSKFVPKLQQMKFVLLRSHQRKGTFSAVMHAMELMRECKLLFGASCCYTSANVETIGSERYIDFLINQGVKFDWF